MSFTLSFSHFPLVNRSCFSSPVVARGVFHPGPKVMLLTAGLTPFTSTSNWKTTQGAPHHINSLRYNVIHITLLKIKKQKRSYQPIHLSYTGEDHASTTHTFIRNETYLSLSLTCLCVSGQIKVISGTFHVTPAFRDAVFQSPAKTPSFALTALNAVSVHAHTVLQGLPQNCGVFVGNILVQPCLRKAY